VAGTRYAVDGASLRVAGAVVSGELVNEQAPGHRFAWALTAHAGGFARFTVDEAPGVGRYQVHDILDPGATQRTADWVQTHVGSGMASFSVGPLAAVLQFRPFRLSFTIDGKPAVSLNSKDMFQFEHRRAKQVRAGARQG